jgi:hypothetical protein
MPFGKKKVGDKEVDFDYIYDKVFLPAIEKTPLPDALNTNLIPHRTDRDFFTGDISNEMFAYLEYSRFALAVRSAHASSSAAFSSSCSRVISIPA